MPEPTPAPHAGQGNDFYAQNPHRLATSLGGAAPGPAAGSGGDRYGGTPGAAAHAQGGGERPCRICATPNGPNLRYCTSCGSTLDPPQAVAMGSTAGPIAGPRMVEPGPTAPAPSPHHGAPAPAPTPFGAAASPYGPAPVPFGGPAPLPLPAPAPAPVGIAPIAPMRVVDLGGGGARPTDGPRMCGRCRGVVDPNAQFCKFCGAPLAEAAAPGGAVPPARASAPAALAALPAPGPSLASSPGMTPRPTPTDPPLMAHDRLSLPRTNGQPAPAPPARAPTVPMNAAGSSLQQHHTPMGEITPAPPPQAQQAYAPPPMIAPSAPPARAASFPPPIPAPHTTPAHAQAPVYSPPVAAPAPAPALPVYGPPPVAPPGAAGASAARTVTRGRLVVIAKSGADGPSYPFGDTLDVGRLEGQIVVGEDPYLSPRHVRIAWTGSKLVLRDLASTNGVYIRLVSARDMNAQTAEKAGRGGPANEAQVPGEVAVPLHDQDLILVGQQVLRFDVVSQGASAEAGFGPAAEHGTLLFGSPAAPRYARLSQRTVEGVTRDVYYVRKVETVLGRESGDVVFTEDPFLSRRHAAIRVLGRDGVPLPAGSKVSLPALAATAPDGVSFALVDLGSSNGSFLRIRNEVDLIAGDHFRVGQQLFRVDFEPSTPNARPAGVG